ncbi:MAG: hypothetical protein GY839_02760 [candidate division Zixibacteria bacterium]|nr:hypothetical protein [candidate division Zixibacteria bacterium]
MFKTILIIALCLIMISCQMKVEPTIDSGIDECNHCTMIIQDVDQGAVTIDSEDNLVTFCSPVCLLIGKNGLKAQNKPFQFAEYLFDHLDTGPIPADRAFIVHGDFNTAMGHGLLAFKSRSEAVKFAKDVQGKILSWNDLRYQHETPDVFLDIEIGGETEPEAFEVMRNQVVSIAFDNPTAQDIKVNLTGYDFEIEIPANNRNTSNLIAGKPGQGFVFQDEAGRIIASLFVTGDHTDEEAVYR